MKLYYSPGACSLSPRIVAAEAGIDLQFVKVDTKTKTIAADGDYWAVNLKGYVPALELDNGEVLTEGPAIVQYLADQKPAAKLAPPNGSWARYRLQEALNYITSEIHKSYSPLFNPKVSTEVRVERVEHARAPPQGEVARHDEQEARRGAARDVRQGEPRAASPEETGGDKAWQEERGTAWK